MRDTPDVPVRESTAPPEEVRSVFESWIDSVITAIEDVYGPVSVPIVDPSGEDTGCEDLQEGAVIIEDEHSAPRDDL